MSSNPIVFPAVSVNDELAKAVAASLNPEELRATIIAEAEKQAKEQLDAASASASAQKKIDDAAAAEAAANGGKPFTRTETIGGKEFTFEAGTELELANMVANAYKVAYAVQPEAHVERADPAVEQASAKAVADAEAARIQAKSELELQFKRGDISVSEYLQRSGAVEEFLVSQGLSVESLKATVDQSQSTQYEKSWQQATEEFLHSPAGAGWPGGKRNLELIGLQLAALNLTDAPDKVAALERAYQSMKERNMVFPGDSVAADVVVPAVVPAAVVTTPAAAVVTTPAIKQKTSSGLFGASSGAGAATEIIKTGDNAAIAIPVSATPAEILEAWKKENLARGIDPNAAFTQAFQKR